MNRRFVKWIIEKNFDLFIIGGFLIYFGLRVMGLWEIGVKNFNEIILEMNVEVIFDYYIVCDKCYFEFFDELEKRLKIFVGYFKVEDRLFEVYRWEFYKIEKGEGVEVFFRL